jgi:hypothetical protein
MRITWVSIAVAAVGFGINSDQVGNVRTLDVGPVEEVLPKIVEFVGEDASLHSDGVISRLTNDGIGHFSEPPDA